MDKADEVVSDMVKDNYFINNLERLKQLLLDSLLGLDHLAQYKLHHLDVKPANILKFQNFYMLTDFGSM